MANTEKQVPAKSVDGKQKPSLTDNKRVQSGQEDGGMRDKNQDKAEQKLTDDQIDDDIDEVDTEEREDDSELDEENEKN